MPSINSQLAFNGPSHKRKQAQIVGCKGFVCNFLLNLVTISLSCSHCCIVIGNYVSHVLRIGYWAYVSRLLETDL